jgi:hypothetical protein
MSVFNCKVALNVIGIVVAVVVQHLLISQMLTGGEIPLAAKVLVYVIALYVLVTIGGLAYVTTGPRSPKRNVMLEIATTISLMMIGISGLMTITYLTMMADDSFAFAMFLVRSACTFGILVVIVISCFKYARLKRDYEEKHGHLDIIS